VQKATDQDLESIWALDYLVLGNPSRKAFLVNAVTAGQCLAARIGGTVVGFGVLEHSFYSHGFISLLIVHPDHRRHGVAKALISHIESISPTQKLFTSTNKSNVIARRLFESLGYVRSGYIENLDEDDPEIIYFKRLEKPDTALTRK
jgi:ribosomal protein S18 acetylase RimI-like enzyme